MQEVAETGARFAINEVAGEIVYIRGTAGAPMGSCHYDVVLRTNDPVRQALVDSLFDQAQIDSRWSRIERHGVRSIIHTCLNSECKGDYEVAWKSNW